MYAYSDLERDLKEFGKVAATGSIGRSLLGNELYFVHMGPENAPQIIITGGIHARENVTSFLVAGQIRALMGAEIAMGLYFIPMVNPDGALLIQNGADAAREYASFVRRVNGGDDFSLWKANARAVDLNLNFDARFGMGRGNIRYPAPHGFIGAKPFSEPETRALADFTLKIRPVYTLSYHALGREVYWYFGQKELKDRRMANLIASELGYRLVDGDLGSAGGYKDWCVMQGIPGVTIEIGSDALAHPVSESDVSEDIARNIDLPEKIIKFYTEVYRV